MMPFKLSMNASYADDKEELQALTGAIKMAKNTGYGIVYPSIKELKLETPELVKQGSSKTKSCCFFDTYVKSRRRINV